MIEIVSNIDNMIKAFAMDKRRKFSMKFSPLHYKSHYFHLSILRIREKHIHKI